MEPHVEFLFAQLPLADFVRDYRDLPRFRTLCQACDNYGQCWSCPPYDFDETVFLSPYVEANLIGARVDVPQEARFCGDGEACRRKGDALLRPLRALLDDALLRLEQELPGGRAFYAGSCMRCPKGACRRRSGEPCVAPEKLRPSIEALGFDVERTASELLATELRWGEPGRLPDYFVLVSGFFSAEPLGNLSERWNRVFVR